MHDQCNQIVFVLRSFNRLQLDIAVQQLVASLKQARTQINGPVMLPTKTKRFDVLRSPHVDSKSKDQYKICTHKRYIAVTSLSAVAIEAIMHLNLHSGVDVKLFTKAVRC